MGSITVKYHDLAACEHALSTFDSELNSLGRVYDDYVHTHLTGAERERFDAALEVMFDIANDLARDLDLVREHGVDDLDGLTFDPDAACAGTCYECTKQDADEFWGDPDFFTMTHADNVDVA